MPTKPEITKTPAQVAFEAAQAQIRGCVGAPDGTTFYTWLRSGEVTRWTRASEPVTVGRAYSADIFSALLERYGVTGLSGAGAGKRPERRTP
jgi:hypothetical protein